MSGSDGRLKMRTQWCRTHADKIAKECGLSEQTATEIKKAAEFCDDYPEFSNCATNSITAILRVEDEEIRKRVINFACGILKKEPQNKFRFTENEIRNIIKQVSPRSKTQSKKDKTTSNTNRAKRTSALYPRQDAQGISSKNRLLTSVLSSGQINTLIEIMEEYDKPDAYSALSLVIKWASERIKMEKSGR